MMIREHFAHNYAPASAFGKPQPLNLKVAVLGSRELKLCLSLDCICVDVPADADDKWLRRNKIDFLLIESTLKDSGGYWRIARYDPASEQATLKLIARFKSHAVPTITWYVTDVSYMPLYAHMTSTVDHVYGVTEEIVAACNELKPQAQAALLPLAVQPLLHNPFHRSRRPIKNAQRGFLHISWADIVEYPDVADELTPVKAASRLKVVESRWKMMTNKLPDIPALEQNIEGYVSYLQLISALKYHSHLLLTQPTLSSSTYRSKRALEALACGMSVTLNGQFDFPLPEILGEAFDSDDIADTLDQLLPSLEKANLERSRAKHQAMHALWQGHTYKHRLRTIAADLRLSSVSSAQDIGASVIAPTKRPHLVPRILENFRQQNYPYKQLLLILNTNDTRAIEETEKLVADSDDITLLVMHQQENIGACLNLAIGRSTGKYWFKMDDDDYYGAGYISDLLLLMETFGLSASGKPPGYTYFEAVNEVHVRNYLRHEYSYHQKSRICGATLCGSRELNRTVPFVEDRRANVDSTFIRDLQASGQPYAAADILNFAIHRSADTSAHTWRFSDDLMKVGGEKVGDRNFLTRINL